jgi:hypothetical protein
MNASEVSLIEMSDQFPRNASQTSRSRIGLPVQCPKKKQAYQRVRASFHPFLGMGSDPPNMVNLDTQAPWPATPELKGKGQGQRSRNILSAVNDRFGDALDTPAFE